MAPDEQRKGDPDATLDEAIAALGEAELREIVHSTAQRHVEVEREVRLVAARASGDLVQLRAEVDRGLRTRRFLDYRDSIAWAQAARPILGELDRLSRSAPSRELVELLQRAVGHVVKSFSGATTHPGRSATSPASCWSCTRPHVMRRSPTRSSSPSG